MDRPRPTVIPAIVALVIFGALLQWFSLYFLPQEFTRASARGLSPGLYISLELQKVEGTHIQQLAADDPHSLVVLGSSELGSRDSFAPDQILTQRTVGFTPFLVGRGGSQSLIQALDAAALGAHLRGRPIALFVSTQWFSTGGLRQDYYENNWSVTKGYELVFSHDLTPELKTAVASRMLQFHGTLRDPVLWALLLGVSAPRSPAMLAYYAALPLGKFDEWALDLQDQFSAYGLLLRHATPAVQPSPPPSPPRPIDWQALKRSAAAVGAASTRNNPYGIQYRRWVHIARDYARYRGSQRNEHYPAASPEFGDFALLFDVFAQLGARPLVVIIPEKGAWYDYTGVARSDRRRVYTTVRSMAEAKGFAVADFSRYEYDPYFLVDSAHVGWRGWVYVDEALASFEASSRAGGR